MGLPEVQVGTLLAAVVILLIMVVFYFVPWFDFFGHVSPFDIPAL